MDMHKQLKSGRISRGLSASEAADKLGISPQYLSRIENGHKMPSESLLERMIEQYGIPLEDAELLKRDAGHLEEDPASMRKATVDIQAQSSIKLDASKTPVLYTDALLLTSDAYGLVINAGQKAGPTNEVHIVARLGLSPEHAKKLHEALKVHVNKFNGGIDN